MAFVFLCFVCWFFKPETEKQKQIHAQLQATLIKMIQALLRCDKLIFYWSNEIYMNSNKNQNSLTRTT